MDMDVFSAPELNVREVGPFDWSYMPVLNHPPWVQSTAHIGTAGHTDIAGWHCQLENASSSTLSGNSARYRGYPEYWGEDARGWLQTLECLC